MAGRLGRERVGMPDWPVRDSVIRFQNSQRWFALYRLGKVSDRTNIAFVSAALKAVGLSNDR
jgi:hypothetical protein